MIQIELFLKYLSSVKRYSENTIIAYKADLYQFYEFCGLERNNEDFSRVTTKRVRECVFPFPCKRESDRGEPRREY